MAKNILIYSDGTGQAGGVRPDQRLSNIYKLYRATRTGPDSAIDPSKQIAFYDPGLGSDEVGGPFWSRVATSVRKFLSSAFGTGLTNNVADCYAYILSVYEPGDRVFLFGFSRGAYTVRSVAGVMNLCGVPIQDAKGNPIPRWGKSLRAIADEAVHSVYEHGAGHPRAKYEDEREEKARRFRIKYQTQDDVEANVRGNVPPYFIGVFDTVAALGSSGFKKFLMILTAIISVIGGIAAVGYGISWLFGWSFYWTAGLVGAAFLIWLVVYSLRVRVKTISDFPKPGQSNWHWSAWRFKHYDRFLDPRVRYARHAQAIDETRSTFSRVGWGRTDDIKKQPKDWLVQVWFAGCHSDIGGSYHETESRLSDIALKWMAKEAEEIPSGIIIDWAKLNLFPDALGMQHCEVEGLRELYPSWVPVAYRRSWKEGWRMEASEAVDFDPTVFERFKATTVTKCGRSMRYRPNSLRTNPLFVQYYEAAGNRNQPKAPDAS